MRVITKDIAFKVEGQELGFRLTKLDAFSGIMLLRLLMRLEEHKQGMTMLDLIASLSEEELRSVMTAVLNHTAVLLPAGPQPVMTGPEWGYPELEHDTPACMKLLMEGIAWNLSGFFGEGGLREKTGTADTSP